MKKALASTPNYPNYSVHNFIYYFETPFLINLTFSKKKVTFK